MRLTRETLKETGFWNKAGIAVPRFDIDAMVKASKSAPKWLHFGAGNLFRAYPAAIAQTLLEQGIETAGIITAVRYDRQTIEKCFGRFDNLTLLVTLKSGGTIEKKIIGSVADCLGMESDAVSLRDVFINPSLQIVSFTITEKGYSLQGKDGLLPDVRADMESPPAAAKSFMGRIAALCYERYLNGGHPLALVSMDNCSHNGEKLFSAVETFAKNWQEKNLAHGGFLDYVRDEKKLSFPWTMIDKITPGPDSGIRDSLISLGMEEMDEVSAGSARIAPFVNAEETGYLVIEDAFPNGRPALEKAGVMFTDRQTVEDVEKMKVGACLNPIHTALAVFGCALGFKKMNEAIKDSDLLKLAQGIGYSEGLPFVKDPRIINPKEFLDQVINVRIPNPFLPDAPARIATDTSQKIPIRFGGTIRAYQAAGKAGALKYIPLVFAGWLRYILGIDDNGNKFEVSPDPLYENLKAGLDGITVGGNYDREFLNTKLKPILSNDSLFGANLYEAGLAEKVVELFSRMIEGNGAIRKTLSETVG